MHTHIHTRTPWAEHGRASKQTTRTRTRTLARLHQIRRSLFTYTLTPTHVRTSACSLTVAGVALAVVAAAAALAGLPGGHLELPRLVLRSHAEHDHGGDLGGGAALLRQIRVHLPALAV